MITNTLVIQTKLSVTQIAHDLGSQDNTRTDLCHTDIFKPSIFFDRGESFNQGVSQGKFSCYRNKENSISDFIYVLIYEVPDFVIDDTK
jgi:hypothetical protein